MKKEPANKEEPPKGPIVKPIIDELLPRPGPPPPTPAQRPDPKAAELDQDPGGGFNPDHSDIQT